MSDTGTVADAPARRPDEVAAHCRVSTATVLRLCRTGKIRAFQVGHQWRISEDEFARLRGGTPA